MSIGLCSTSDIIAIIQNWHHVYSNSEEGKSLSFDTQISVTISIEPEISTKVLRNLDKKLGAKFPSTTLSYSMLRNACFNDAFSGILELEASQAGG